jgi:hypothetical protein
VIPPPQLSVVILAEVPVNWADQEGGKVGVPRSGPGMVRQLVQTWRRVGRR